MTPASQPFALLIAGGSGTGKSTVAREVAQRLQVDRLVSTDILRVAMRAATTVELSPELYRESFEGDLDDVSNFEEQSRTIAVAVNDVLAYCAAQRWSVVVEGVHLAPGMIQPPAGLPVVHVLLVVHDESTHAARFRARADGTGGGRPAEVYLQNLTRIRGIQQYLLELGRIHETAVVDNDSVEAAVDEICMTVR